MSAIIFMQVDISNLGAYNSILLFFHCFSSGTLLEPWASLKIIVVYESNRCRLNFSRSHGRLKFELHYI